MIDIIYEKIFLKKYISNIYFIIEYNCILNEIKKTDEEIDPELLNKYLKCEEYCHSLETNLNKFLKKNITKYESSKKFSLPIYHYILNMFFELIKLSDKKKEKLNEKDFLICILYIHLYKNNEHKIEKLKK